MNSNLVAIHSNMPQVGAAENFREAPATLSAEAFRNNREGYFVELKAYHSADDLQKLEPAWNDLIADYAPASIFCTSDWLTAWWLSFGKHQRLVILGLFDHSSRLLGLAPLSISTEKFSMSISLRVLCLMGDGSGDSDNLDFPVRSGFEKVFARLVLEYLNAHKNEWDIAKFNTMPRESPVAGYLAQLLKVPAWASFDKVRHCSAIPLPSKWETYFKGLSTEDRRNLARYDRRLRKRYSVKTQRCDDRSRIPEYLDALFKLHQLRWTQVGQTGSFSSRQRCEFYADLAQRLFARNRLELWTAELDGKIAAVQFAMRYGDRVYQLQEGYDTAHSSDRIGFILRGEVLRTLISEGVRTYDFLGGEDEYKARWGAEAGYYRDLHFARSFSIGGVLLNCVNRASAGKEWLRDHTPRSVWNAMHKMNLALRRKEEFNL